MLGSTPGSSSSSEAALAATSTSNTSHGAAGRRLFINAASSTIRTHAQQHEASGKVGRMVTSRARARYIKSCQALKTQITHII
eukprot:5233783-Pleurochrysis_carterae.AAC.2